MSVLNPVVDIKEWCERYGIDMEPRECIKCKKLLEFKIPVALPKYRGASCDVNDHECGVEYTPARFVPISENEIAIWNSLRDL